jgi:hypothetical protein
MAWLPKLLRGGFLLRAAVRELVGIRRELERQTQAMERLVAQFAPETKIPVGSKVDSTAVGELVDTGVSFLDPLEAAIVEDYVEKVQHDLGRSPDADEVITYLADEKTQSLHERLKARAAEHRLRWERLQDEVER